MIKINLIHILLISTLLSSFSLYTLANKCRTKTVTITIRGKCYPSSSQSIFVPETSRLTTISTPSVVEITTTQPATQTYVSNTTCTESLIPKSTTSIDLPSTTPNLSYPTATVSKDPFTSSHTSEKYTSESSIKSSLSSKPSSSVKQSSESLSSTKQSSKSSSSAQQSSSTLYAKKVNYLTGSLSSANNLKQIGTLTLVTLSFSIYTNF